MPVYNDQEGLGQCLTALTTSCPPGAEIIVVDDASTDGSAAVAARPGVRCSGFPTNAGPAAARNYGAQHARGDALLFVDSDVVVAPGTLEQVATLLAGHPDVAAVFGSYDASPAAAGTVSRYKNLLHHFVHQDGAAEASTFWAGCGAIRRSAFAAVGGFDQARFRRPSIEDIELGQRLRRAGHRILLDKTLQVNAPETVDARVAAVDGRGGPRFPWSRRSSKPAASARPEPPARPAAERGSGRSRRRCLGLAPARPGWPRSPWALCSPCWG